MHQRIDNYPTHRHGDFLLRAGRPLPFGASHVPGGVNFAVFSRHATRCTLVLYDKGHEEPLAEIPIPVEFRIGDVFAIIVFDLNVEKIEYGFQMDGPHAPHRGFHYDPGRVLLDPYAKCVGGLEVWGERAPFSDDNHYRGRLIYDDFDWTGDRPLETPIEELVIYEMHVRGFTRHPSSGVKYPGTFAGIREKILYLKQLGVNCVELMPIHEFDELENKFVNPDTGERNRDYWGYSPVAMFAPKAGYASTGRFGMQADELKALVKLLHRHGIEVILDVVFNHTAEGDLDGPTFSFRGLDNHTYYMLKPDGTYYNFSGCGNTMNCNNPVVRNMVMDCLRYWAAEYHIDGFRFDLASILGRDSKGHPLTNPPLLEMMAYDPILGKTKLIAEAWDAGGLYQVGTFPAYGRWTEWNGKYRDTLRRFLRGDMGQVGELAQRIQGSPDLYAGRGPIASINFITCHDGFTLADLFAYNEKHNAANGENNQDGADENYSWNCGHEGPAGDPAINRLRRRMMKNGIAILMVSQGVPMILMGDEVGHSKQGNNNTYCQDNPLSWLNWAQTPENQALFTFFQTCIAFRKAHPSLRRRTHLRNEDYLGSGYPDISWHGVESWNPDWAYHSRILAFMLDGPHAPGGADDTIYVGMNMYWEALEFELPHLPAGQQWHLFLDTFAPDSTGLHVPGEEPQLAGQSAYTIGPRSVLVLVGRAPEQSAP